MFIGQRAQELRGLLKIRYPLEHGIVTDWDDMERIWEFVYGEGLKTLSEEVSLFFGVREIICQSQSCSAKETAGFRWSLRILLAAVVNMGRVCNH